MLNSGLKSVLAAATAIALASPAAAAMTVNATVTSFLSGTMAVTRTVINPANVATVFATRMIAVENPGSTYAHDLLVGATPGGFVAFCIEPLEELPVGTGVSYKVVPLSMAGSGFGGIGATKANYIRELFGRFAPAGGFATMSAGTSAAFQLAIWEIVAEDPSNAFNLTAGNIRMNRGTVDTASYNTARLWLTQLNGTGPLAKGLVVLQNGTRGVQGSGTQDLLAFAAVPEPSNWALLIAGFGMTGAVMRRRRGLAKA